MPSSISNSDNAKWGKCWILALVIAVCVLAFLELFWRSNGYKPAIVDDQRLWSIERSKIGKSDKEIALLGSSRMETDISTKTLRNLAPQYTIANLSVDGACANAVLRDLAEDANFKGVAICETTSECLLFGDSGELSQRAFPQYYRNVYNLNIKANREIATVVQKHLSIVDPYLNLVKVFGDLIVKRKLRPPNYVTVHEDRTRAADYTKLDINSHRATRLKKVETNYQKITPEISVCALIERVDNLQNALKKIQDRGGKVVFMRFPVSDEHWTIDEKYFPRNKYWDSLPSITKAEVIHFKDIDGMTKLKCPDTSHLDLRDTPEFTTLLFNELVRRKIL